MIEARPLHAGLLDFVEIDGFENPGRLDDAVKGIDAVIHVASVSNFSAAWHKVIFAWRNLTQSFTDHSPYSLLHTTPRITRQNSSFPPSMASWLSSRHRPLAR
jgi:hypothetical protein